MTTEEAGMRLSDVRLLVDRFDECVDFYRDAMGLRLRLMVPEGVYAEFEGGGAVLGVYRRRLMSEVLGVPHEDLAPRVDRVAIVFEVPEVDAACRELEGLGVELVTRPHAQEAWGQRVAHLRDPDGT